MDLWEKYQEFERYAITLTPADLAALDDDTLTEALRARVMHYAQEKYGFDVTKASDGMSLPLRTAFVLFSFDAEIQNGGLDQFFFNSTSELAPYVADALMLVGACEYADLFAHACEENGIDPCDSSTFEDDDEDDEDENLFDEFDDAYYALYEEKPLEPYITRYVRAHLEDF